MVVGYPILRLSMGLQVQFFIFSWVKYESPKIVCVASQHYKYQIKSLWVAGRVFPLRGLTDQEVEDTGLGDTSPWPRWKGDIYAYCRIIHELHSITKSMQSSDQTDKCKD
jgi:hypothetical protein